MAISWQEVIFYIFEFQLVPFAFSLILGDLFMASPFPLYAFHGGQILWGKFIGDCST